MVTPTPPTTQRPSSGRPATKSRYYLDCEFNGMNGELLSLALVREGGGGGYFIILPSWIKAAIDPWVAANVMPIITNCAAAPLWVTPEELPHAIGRLFEEWADPDPVIITDWPDDIKYFCQHIITGPGTMISARSLRFEMHRVDAYPTTLPGAVQHNAWWDALALRHLLSDASEESQDGAPEAAPWDHIKPFSGDDMSAPEGWKLVPVEPTEAMADVGQHTNSEWLNDDAPLGERMYRAPAEAVYKAMVQAASSAPLPPVEDGWLEKATAALKEAIEYRFATLDGEGLSTDDDAMLNRWRDALPPPPSRTGQ